MSLTAADVAEIMKILEGSSFDEVLLEIDGLKLSMRRGAAAADGSAGAVTRSAASAAAASAAHGASQHSAPAIPQAAASTQNSALAAHAAANVQHSAHGAHGAANAQHSAIGAPTPAGAPAEVTRKATASTDPSVHDVTSPLLGTCYRAPKPGAPPFVEVGTVVSEETVVAIVEVMKLMNTVRAGVKGTVTEILMRDGALVEYGEALLRIKKAV